MPLGKGSSLCLRGARFRQRLEPSLYTGLFLSWFRSVPLPLQIIETTTALFDLVVLLTHAVPVSRTGGMVNQTSAPTNSLFWRCANSKWNWSGFGVGPFTCVRPQ